MPSEWPMIGPTPDPESEYLELASVPQIVKELRRRHPAVVVAVLHQDGTAEAHCEGSVADCLTVNDAVCNAVAERVRRG